MLLAECDQKYEDFRIPGETWLSVKNNYIFTQVIRNVHVCETNIFD